MRVEISVSRYSNARIDGTYDMVRVQEVQKYGRPCSKWSTRTASTERSVQRNTRMNAMSVSAASDVSRDVKPMYVAASLLCVLCYLYEYSARFAAGVIQRLLSTAWGGHHIGSMISSYYIAYALTALAVGLLLDRCGASRVLPYATSIVAAGLSTAFADRRVPC
jgi:hypothetical protein